MSRDECEHGSLRRACALCDAREEIAELQAQVESLRDCQTCRNYRFDVCLSVIKCVDGAAYQRGGWSVRLWEAK